MGRLINTRMLYTITCVLYNMILLSNFRKFRYFVADCLGIVYSQVRGGTVRRGEQQRQQRRTDHQLQCCVLLSSSQSISLALLLLLFFLLLFLFFDLYLFDGHYDSLIIKFIFFGGRVPGYCSHARS